jgi:DNA-binding PadR family transcriptional regulator
VNEPLPRVSPTEHIILTLLSREKELFGLQIVEQSGGAVKRGTVYVTLGRMHDKGFVESRTEPRAPGAIGLPRRLFRLTPYGGAVLKTWTRATRALARLRPAEA